MEKKIKKIITVSLKLLVSIGFLVLVIYQTNWVEVYQNLQTINIWWLVLYTFILLLGIFISSYKWKLLTAFKGIYSSHWNFFKLYLIGTFINNFMPSFIAGDAFKAYQIGSPKNKYAEATSAVLMDRITGFVGATFLAIFFSLLNYKVILANKVLIIINILLILSFGIDIFIAWIKKISPLKNWILKVTPQKIIHFLRELYSYNNKNKTITKSIWLSILFSIVGVALLNYILFAALGIKIGILNYLSVIFLISIISALPISINNIGLKEWAYITLFGLFGVNTSAVVTVAIISRFMQMLVSFLALPSYLKIK